MKEWEFCEKSKHFCGAPADIFLNSQWIYAQMQSVLHVKSETNTSISANFESWNYFGDEISRPVHIFKGDWCLRLCKNRFH